MKKSVGVVFAILLGFICLPVRANLITIAISGHVTGVDDQYGHFENKIHVGDTITGTYTYDSTALDSLPSNPTVAQYWNYSTPAGISISIGGFTFETNSTNVKVAVTVRNDDLGQDWYGIGSSQNLPLSDGTRVQSIGWVLGDYTATALSSKALPLTAPDLSKWNYNLLDISRDRDFGITGTITSAVLVPEPATLLLLVFGISILKRR